MFSRWPRYLSHGPAMEMWSVVHLPRALATTSRSSKSAPSQGSKGSSNCRRCEPGATRTSTPEPSAGGATKVSRPGSNPRSGSSTPAGADRRTGLPSGSVSSSAAGSKSMVPARARATTVSGEVTKASVAGSPSLRLGKLRL